MTENRRHFPWWAPWSIPLIIVLAAVALLVLYQREYKQTEEAVFRTLIEKVSQRTATAVGQYFQPVDRVLKIARDWSHSDDLFYRDITSFKARLIPVIEDFRQITSVMIANSRGQQTMVRRKGNDWTASVLNAPKDGYDPRKRPWFRGAIAAHAVDQPFWTAPYTFYSEDKPGITAALTWQNDADPALVHVVAVDVLLEQISDLTMDAEISPRGLLWLFTSDGRVFALPQDPRFHDSAVARDAILEPVDSLAIPFVTKAFDEWRSLPKKDHEIVRFASGGEPWWGGFRTLTLGDQTIWVAVALPQTDLIERIDFPLKTVSIAIIGGGLLLSLISALVIHRYVHGSGVDTSGNAIDGLATPEMVEDVIKAGETERVEFKSTVRFNLNSGKPGKEIELAWLKGLVGFLNTSGGMLLLGVDDGGNLLGLSSDNFANDDKCLRHIDNLITQHIGSEFAHCIQVSIVQINEHAIAVVQCRSATMPAFLHHNGEEIFYVRSGPASRKLPTSQALRYLQARTK